MRRVYSDWIERLSQKKFLFLSGPRQVGKTTLGQMWINSHGGTSLNWDIPEERERILTQIFSKKIVQQNFTYLLLDEVHKYQRWKSALKGLYDRKLKDFRLLVTGSARLDTYQKGGDSLLGRYEHLRILPLTLGEVTHGQFKEPPPDWNHIPPDTADDFEKELERLERLSGFPEPFLSNDPLEYNRWALKRRDNLIRQDLRDISDVRLVTLVEQLVLLLPPRVGSPLSINSLRNDLQVGHDTVSHWLELLERLYFVFMLPPFSKKIARSLKKERKLYFYDWAVLKDAAARFENLVALHLLKAVQLWKDVGYGDYGLHYFRDKEKREIDFIMTLDQKPVLAVECKLNSEQVSESFARFRQVFPETACIQVVRKSGVDFKTPGGVRVVSAGRFLQKLN